MWLIRGKIQPYLFGSTLCPKKKETKEKKSFLSLLEKMRKM